MAEDLMGLGRAAEKLLEVVASAIGVLYKPRAIRLEGKAQADAHAYEIEVSAQAARKAAGILADTEAVIQQRAVERIRATEMLRQRNIDDALQGAIAIIEATPAEEQRAEAIGLDWITRYLDYVKDVNDAQVRSLWSRILARQAQGGHRRLSLMTLDSLRLLERPHAVLFEQIARRVASFRTCFPFLTEQPRDTDYGGQSALHALEELGFISIRNLRSPGEMEYLHFVLPTFTLRLFEDEENTSERLQTISEFGLSYRGQELARVILDDDKLIPYWADFEAPPPETRFRHMPRSEQTETFRYWFDVLQNKGGYKVRLSFDTEFAEARTFGWKDGQLVIPNYEGARNAVPPELQPLMSPASKS